MITLRLKLCLLFVLGLTAGLTHAEVTIFVAKKVITMDPARPIAGAIAVEAGRIRAVGSLEEVRRHLLEKGGHGKGHHLDTTFEKSVLLPGLVENHLHPIMAALLLPMEFITPFDWRFPGREVKGVQGQPAYRASLVAAESAHPDGQWFFTWGYHHYFHGDMSRTYLDSVSKNRPIIVWHRSFHELYVNSAALAAMGVTVEDVVDHPHVDFERGHFFETGLSAAFTGLGGKLLAPERLRQGLELTRKIVHQGGITTIGDMAAGGFNLELTWPLLLETLDDPSVPFRTLMIGDGRAFGEPPGSAEGLARLKQLRESSGDQLRWVKQIKLFADGAFYSQLMQMNPPGYLDGHHGEWMMEPAALLAAARRYWHAGYQIHVHTNGDRGADVVLDVLETLLDEAPRDDHRFTLHHVGYSTPAQAERMAKLGAHVSANPYYLYTLGDKYSEVGLGPDRAAKIFLGATMLRAGVPLSLHSDFTMAPAEPLTLAWVAANRVTAFGTLLSPEERLTLDQALAAVTIDAARAIRMEADIGSITIGKKADFTVLAQDPYAIPVMDLNRIPITATVFEGRVHPIDMLP